MSRRINGAGLLERRPVGYLRYIALAGGLYVAGWFAFFLVGDAWTQMLVAVLLAVASAQVTFLGHDAGHRQMFRRRHPSDVLGLLVALAVGISYGWWVDKHVRHHANPNHEDEDPDVGAGALVWTTEQALATSGFTRWVARRQAYLFFPMLTLQALAMRVASLRAVFERGPGRVGYRTPIRHRGVEALFLLLHFAAYLGAVLTVLSPAKALVFTAVHQGLFGVYLGCSFAPNHKGMLMPTAEDRLDFLRKQVLTSRNIRGGRLVDTVLGELNYQIEHHLFPSMPRANLRRAQPIVRAFCAERGIPYEETGWLESYRQALRHLHGVGAPLRA